jgi:hypothetical protein
MIIDTILYLVPGFISIEKKTAVKQPVKYGIADVISGCVFGKLIEIL